jgi:hypothetical protein
MNYRAILTLIKSNFFFIIIDFINKYMDVYLENNYIKKKETDMKNKNTQKNN